MTFDLLSRTNLRSNIYITLTKTDGFLTRGELDPLMEHKLSSEMHSGVFLRDAAIKL